MAIELLSRILRRVKRNDVREFITDWGYLTDSVFVNVSERATKQVFVAAILKECKKRNIDLEAVEELDLQRVARQSKTKLWKSFKIVLENDDVPCKTFPPTAFQARLVRQLQRYFEARVCLISKDDMYWIRVTITEDGIQGTSRVVYFVYHPNSTYVFAADLRVSIGQYLLQAFVKVLDGTSYEDSLLEGHCVTSLAQLTIWQNCQGSFSKFRLNQADDNILTTQKKRKYHDNEDLKEGTNEKIYNEGFREKRRRKEILEDKFGTDPLPTLEKIDYTLNTTFAGLAYAPAMTQYADEIFHCRVKFEGSSVLDGLHNLGRAGLAELPMRSFLSEVHTMARNKFLLQKKPKRGGDGGGGGGKQRATP